MQQCKVDVAEEDLSTFLELVEDLQIRGLSERNKDHSDPEEPMRDDPSIVTKQNEKDTLNNLFNQCNKDQL